MSEIHRACDFAGNANGVLENQLSLARDACPQRLPFDERHDEVERVANLSRIEDGQNVRVSEVAGDLDLAPKALVADGSREILMEDFDRDRSVVPEVACAVDRGHSAAPDLPLHVISRAEVFAQASFVHRLISVVGGSPILEDPHWFRKWSASSYQSRR